MKRILPLLKNKFVITFSIFFVYLTLIDDNDIFYVFNQKQKLQELQVQNEAMQLKLIQTKEQLKKIGDLEYLEAYAREKKFFKRIDEDIFVITND